MKPVPRFLSILGVLTLASGVTGANTAPVAVPFSDNETVNVALSVMGVNRLVVRDDQIQNVTCPTGFCTLSSQKKDKSGASYLSLNTSAPFTFYVTTEKGRNFGVFVTLKTTPATTTEFIGLANPNKTHPIFAKKMPYTALLADLMKAMITWSDTQALPADLRLHRIASRERQKFDWAAKKRHALAVIPQAILVGQPFNGVVYRLVNYTGTLQSLRAADFYTVSACAASLSQETIEPKASAYLYVITGAGRGLPWAP